jgi:hypothetical protein
MVKLHRVKKRAAITIPVADGPDNTPLERIPDRRTVATGVSSTMANVQRRPNILPLLGIVCLPIAASATELRVIGDAGTVATTVELATARYDVTQKRVVVTTRAGNVICNGGQAATSGQFGLEVDGSAYAVMTDPPGSAQDVPVNVTLGSGPAYTLAVANAQDCKSSDATTANLKLAFDTGVPLTIGEAVYFNTGTRTFDIRVVEPVMCNSYATDATGLAIRLTEANGVAEVIRGFQNVDYQLAASLLRATSRTQENGGRLVQCFSFAGGAAQAPGASPSGSDSIFGARFEYDDVSADLEVSVNNASVSLLAGGAQAFQYTLTIANTGNGVATGVRAREYLPALSVGTISAAGWTCERFAGTSNTNLGCDAASGTGVLNQLSASLAPGERLVYTLNRSVLGGAAGTNLLLGGAAFVNPDPTAPEGRPERDYSDNSARVAVALVSNQPPSVQQPLAQITSEDGAPVTIVYTATDPEGNTILTPSITSSSPTLFPGPLTAVSTGTNQWSVTLTPAANRNGIATITASFTDGNSQPVQIASSVTVSPVNDAPSFTLGVAGGAVTVTQGDANCGASGSCIASASNFIAALQPGPAGANDEATQVVRPNTAVDGFGDQRLVAGACRAAATGGIDPAVFFTDGVLPRVNEPTPGSFNLLAALTRTVGAVECDITVIDNGSPAATSEPQTLTIRYQVPTP